MSKRVRDGEIRIQGTFSEWTPEGAGERGYPEYIATSGTREMPEICWYLASARPCTVNQGGTADKVLFVLDRRKGSFVTGRFLLPLAKAKSRR